MTENATPADSGARRPLHPFFAQNRVSVPAADKPPVDDHRGSDKNAVLPADATSPEKSEDDAAEQPGSRPGRRPGTRRKADQELNDDDLQKKTRPRKRTRNSAGGGIEAHFVRLPKGSENNADKLGHDEDLGPKSSTPKKGAASNPLNHAHNGDRDPPVNSAGANPPTSDQASEPATRLPAVEGSPARPRKLLRFNPKTGTIGSPPKAKKSRANTESETGEGEKRPAQRRSRKSSSKVVRITYGTDIESRARIGKLINAIMSSQTPKPATDHCPGTPKRAASKPSKVLHPFFSGQAKKPDSSPAKVKTIQYTSTPCSPRKQRVGSAAKMPMPQFGVRNLGLKFPGAKLPAWPWKGMVHVRDDGSETACVDDSQLPLPARKSKGNAVKVPLSESIIGLITQSMAIPTLAEAVRNIDTDEITPPPDELRLPEKHFESGSKLQSRISSELRSFQFLPPMKDADQRRGPPRNGKGRFGVPAQLARLFASISTSLSAFDMSRCETANWVQKYAPTSAVEILQPGREVFLLRDWLQALTVQSVDTGSAEPEKSRVGPKIKGPGAGKKKRRKRLDGFIVSSEDEDYELSEVPDESDDWAPSGSRGVLRRTVVRSPNSSKGKGSEKTANALVISGPPGCGKTAAVYAVAKELDFEVFEINPSSRRSGKDVLEKIGDMTRNHHVQQQQSAGAADKPESAAEDGIAKDIKSGKQSTMNTFFKPKSAGTKPKKPAKPSLPQVVQDDVKKEPPKTQKQSLILLEEVDILYEEDKQFWNTVLGLIAQSRRPFIITCNDETLVPLHALRLHGIFRLSTPPTDLAVDRLILIAANEGHALTRQSVEQLYQSRNCDLRAATMDLQYWCQIGVGDRRGGFDWFYPRWPKGIDLDENKETVRVVSQGTYLPGMNLLGRDPILDCKPFPGLIEEEIIHQIWESWGFDIGHWQDSVGLDAWAESLGPLVDAPAERLGALEAYDGLTEAMSAADICSSRLFAVFKEEMVDATQPEPGAQIRDDFVVGLTHLDTPRITYYNSLSLSIASTIRSLAKCSLQLQTEKLQKHAAPSLLPLDESQAIHSLQSSFTSTPPGAPVMNRIDFALAFDPIAAADPSPLQSTSHLEPSVFDRTLKLITLEVAPYVRSIVAYDSRLQKQRLKLSNLVSEGGRGSQGSRRMRTTRSALSALAGGSRSTTRGERWFKADINPYLVAKTAGEGWNCFDSDESGTPEKSTQSTPKSTSKSTPQTSPDTTPTKTPRKVMLKGRKRKRILHDNDDADELGC